MNVIECAQGTPEWLAARAGKVTIGGTVAPGVPYFGSATAGGICPVADIGAGEYVCAIGVSESTTVLRMNIQYSAVSL